MMTALIAVGALNLLGLTFMVAAGRAAKRPMPQAGAGTEAFGEAEYVAKPRSSRPRLLVPAVSH